MKSFIVMFCLLLTACSTTKSTRVYNTIRNSSGTAFNVDYKGHKFGVTAGHVCARSGSGNLATSNNGEIREYKILKFDNVLDLCVTEPFDSVPALYLLPEGVEPNSFIIRGFPSISSSETESRGTLQGIAIMPGLAPTQDDGTCTENGVLLKTEDDESACFGIKIRAVTDAKIYFGNSGGPVLDPQNRVCGVVSAIGSTGSPTFFTPTPLLAPFLDSLIEN